MRPPAVLKNSEPLCVQFCYEQNGTHCWHTMWATENRLHTSKKIWKRTTMAFVTKMAQCFSLFFRLYNTSCIYSFYLSILNLHPEILRSLSSNFLCVLRTFSRLSELNGVLHSIGMLAALQLLKKVETCLRLHLVTSLERLRRWNELAKSGPFILALRLS